MDFADEKWLPVVGHEGAYSVSSYGRVRSEPRVVDHANAPLTIRGRILRQAQRQGYLKVSLSASGKFTQFSVHRLVLEAFVGPRPLGADACHGNGDRGDNRVQNLRWDTRKANMADKRQHGTDPRGERSSSAKLTEGDVRCIRADSRYQREIAADYGVCREAISQIKRGKTWSHLSQGLAPCS